MGVRQPVKKFWAGHSTACILYKKVVSIRQIITLTIIQSQLWSMLAMKRALSEEGRGRSWGDRERRAKEHIWNPGYHVIGTWGSAGPDCILGLGSLLRHLSWLDRLWILLKPSVGLFQFPLKLSSWRRGDLIIHFLYPHISVHRRPEKMWRRKKEALITLWQE